MKTETTTTTTTTPTTAPAMTTTEWANVDHQDLDRWIIRADHGIRDEKGRAIGGYAYLDPHLQHRDESGARLPEPIVTGKWEVRVQATRNGHTFGASFPRPTIYASKEEAQAGALKSLAAQGRRYWKMQAK